MPRQPFGGDHRETTSLGRLRGVTPAQGADVGRKVGGRGGDTGGAGDRRTARGCGQLREPGPGGGRADARAAWELQATRLPAGHLSRAAREEWGKPSASPRHPRRHIPDRVVSAARALTAASPAHQGRRCRGAWDGDGDRGGKPFEHRHLRTPPGRRNALTPVGSGSYKPHRFRRTSPPDPAAGIACATTSPFPCPTADTATRGVAVRRRAVTSSDG